MFLVIRDEGDLDKLESLIRETLRSKRMDVSLLKSMAYIELRQNIIKNKLERRKTIHFSNENVYIEILSVNPLTVYCGHKDIVNDGINEIEKYQDNE